MQIDQTKIEAAIIREVADHMIGEDRLYERAKDAIIAKVDALWSSSVKDRIEAEINAAIRNGFDREFQKVDSFGRPVGEKTTVAAQLERMIAGYWNERVGTDGKPTSSSYGNPLTRAEWLMAQMCAADFKDAVKQHAVNVTGALKDAFRSELHQTVNRLLSELFHVRSADDQGQRRQDRSTIAPVASA